MPVNRVFGKAAFKVGLEELGYLVEEGDGNRLTFKFKINGGRFAGTQVQLGLEVPPDFDVTCPTGPHICPRLIPLNPGGTGNDRAHESPFGADWEYLSRPFGENQKGWNRVNRSARAYVRHITRILDAL